MAVHTFEYYAVSVQIEAVIFAEFYSAETNFFRYAVQNFFVAPEFCHQYV